MLRSKMYIFQIYNEIINTHNKTIDFNAILIANQELLLNNILLV
jgi:hypothetical protein